MNSRAHRRTWGYRVPGRHVSSCPWRWFVVGFQLSRLQPQSLGRRPNDPAPSSMIGHSWQPGVGARSCSPPPTPNACAGQKGVRWQEGVHSLRCSANTGSRKLIRLPSMSRFLPTPMLMTQLCSCGGWVGGRETESSGLQGTRKASCVTSSPVLESLCASGSRLGPCLCESLGVCVCGVCVQVYPSVYMCARTCVSVIQRCFRCGSRCRSPVFPPYTSCGQNQAEESAVSALLPRWRKG